jgi:hypothetical protein
MPQLSPMEVICKILQFKSLSLRAVALKIMKSLQKLLKKHKPIKKKKKPWKKFLIKFRQMKRNPTVLTNKHRIKQNLFKDTFQKQLRQFKMVNTIILWLVEIKIKHNQLKNLLKLHLWLWLTMQVWIRLIRKLKFKKNLSNKLKKLQSNKKFK